MRYAHHLVFTFFARPDEDVAPLRKILLRFAPEDPQYVLKEEVADPAGGFKEVLRILTLSLDKATQITTALRRLLALLDRDAREALSRQAEDRLDDNFNFFMRFDKPALLRGEWKLTGKGDCLHIRIALAAYPKTRENALAVLDKIYKDLSPRS